MFNRGSGWRWATKRMETGSSQKTILCIEDEVEILDLLKIILERFGFNYIGAFGGGEGLKKALETKPDLILLDLMMPDMDGWEVYRRIRENDALNSIPIIIVTVRSTFDDRMTALRSEQIADYVLKPFTVPDLLRRVHVALGLEAEAA
ncbi:MAG: response regulator [Anaerolineae bacterium]|nr:response regulator [Anaerolineae bacterium]